MEMTRLLARQLRTVIRKLLGNVRPDLTVRTGPFGLVAEVQASERALQYRDAAAREPAELTMPFDVLDDVQGTKPDPVVLSLPKKDVLAASWTERGVAQTIQYDLPKTRSEPFPALPASLAANPPTLLAALQHACETTDPGSSRYALGCIQLRGKTGQIATTDGHQLLLQSGYTFGFDDDVLVPGTNVFGCNLLPQGESVLIGKTDHHVAVRVGPWTFALWMQKEGRFPAIQNVIPGAERATTTLELAPADAEFFLANANRLPGHPDERAVTLDLGSTVAVRAKTAETERPLELVLSNSRRQGEDVRIAIDRHFLARAAAMGFGQLYLYGPEDKLLAQDDGRQYVWMPLSPEAVVLPSENCLRIESPQGAFAAAARSRSRPIPRTTIPMRTSPQAPPPAVTPATDSTSPPQPVRRRRVAKSSAGALQQALALRDQLRSALTSNRELIRALKTEQRSQKSLKAALDSLKQLQAVA